MRIRFITQLRTMLSNTRARESYMDIVQLRQRVFEAEHRSALCIDRYDLIADHVIIYAGDDFSRPMAHIRSVTADACQFHGLALPFEAGIEKYPDMQRAVLDFKTAKPTHTNMGFTCFDHAYRAELAGVKVTDFLIWCGFQANGPVPRSVGLCATINSKYKLRYQLGDLAEEIIEFPPFIHSTLPQPHELVLISKLSDRFWDTGDRDFTPLLQRAEWLGTVSDPIPIRKSA
jgi:hypothetical protein